MSKILPSWAGMDISWSHPIQVKAETLQEIKFNNKFELSCHNRVISKTMNGNNIFFWPQESICFIMANGQLMCLIVSVFISRDGHEIAVVYFRCGYDPDNYASDTVGSMNVHDHS